MISTRFVQGLGQESIREAQQRASDCSFCGASGAPLAFWKYTGFAVPPVLTRSGGSALAAVLANREEVQKGLGFLLGRINNTETQVKSHGVLNAGGLARSLRGNCQEQDDKASLRGMHFQGGLEITCIPPLGKHQVPGYEQQGSQWQGVTQR